jgi:hypothetical protein
MALDLKPGDTIRRADLHQQYGGRRQGGIAPSKVTSNVFLITAPEGKKYGYGYDGTREDDPYFHYTGEGQVGDQRMIQGNRAIRDHAAEGRELHLFSANGTELTYVGRFEYVDHYLADSHEDGSERDRSVIVFRLKRRSGSLKALSGSKLDRLGRDPIKEIPVEQLITESTVIGGEREPYEAERREQKLVLAFADWLERQGREVCRYQLLPDDEPAPIFCDVIDKTTNTLYEAKGTVARSAIRMAIGQLADYSRLIRPTPSKALLVPQAPRPDLLTLLADQGISATWPDGDGFVSAGD